MTKHQPTTFLAWCQSYGATKLARDLGLAGPNAVHRWKRGLACPSFYHATVIVKLSKGALTLEQVLRGAK